MKTVDGINMSGKHIKINVSDLKFRPAIYAIIVENNKLLMTKFGDYGYYFIGGGIELGENHKDALVRELKEETGLDISVKNLLDVYSYFFHSPIKKHFTQTIAIFYTCKIKSEKKEELTLSESEKELGITPEWIELKDLKTIKIAGGSEPFVKKIIDKILNLYE